MPFDQAPPIRVAQAPEWSLPQIQSVAISKARYAPRASKHFASPLDAVDDAVQIVVSLQTPLPIRAMAPALWVGGEQLTESEVVDPEGKQIRFWSLKPANLQADAGIRLTWMNEAPAADAADAAAPAFTYTPPK